MSGVGIAIVGCGNTGSAQVQLAGRSSAVETVTLIDHGHYEAKDLSFQQITPAAVGRPKAAVQAEALRLLRPSLEVRPIVEPLENVPRGLLRGAAVLGCLDSRASRLALCEAAFRIGVPLIDAGVLADGRLARVTVFLPGGLGPCYGCNLDPADLAELCRQRYPCGRAAGPAAPSAPSGASPALGALAASLQALELERLLAGGLDPTSPGREVLVDALHQKCIVSVLRRNPDCRFCRRVAAATALPQGPSELSALELCRLLSEVPGSRGGHQLEVEGRLFATQLACVACLEVSADLGLWGRLEATRLGCRRCGRPREAVGTALTERLDLRSLGSEVLEGPLAALGILPGDIVTIHTAAGAQHFELALTPTGPAHVSRNGKEV